VHLTLVRVEQGRGAEVLDVLRTFAVTYPRTVAWRAMYAFVLSRTGQSETCAAEYASIKANRFAQPDDLLWLLATAAFAEVCHDQDDADGAGLLYERLLPFASRVVVIGFGIACWGSAERYLGLLCATMGRHAIAAEHFERALVANRRIQGALPLAYTLYDYAVLLRHAGDDAERARDYLQQAEDIAQSRDLTALQARITALRELARPA
jgi:tetratricopeptide (TPR) repeat protein